MPKTSVSDRRLIFASAFLRSAAVGLSGVILALHIARMGFNPLKIGATISLGLAGCAAGTWLVAYFADNKGRRSSLIAVSLLMAGGGLAVAYLAEPGLLMAAAFIGMVNGMGRDRGAGLTLDQSMLSQTSEAASRTTAFAWYNLIVDAGHAAGALLALLPAFFQRTAGVNELDSYHFTWLVYSALCLIAAALVTRLSPGVETKNVMASQPLSPQTRKVVARFAALSGLDSLGGGFLTTALVSYWFFQRFGADESFLGPLFFVVRILNGLSHLGAAWLAQRVGLVNTMVFTHIPSSLLLMAVPFAPSLTVAVVLFLIREGLVEMDVPTRQSYLMAVVGEEERTKAAGITNLVRGGAWAVAPVMAGSLMKTLSLSSPLFIGSGLKIVYDLLLYRAFRKFKPPEEL
ncbi:MAG TPA: MFS transporter [candidate division Zixibacteria bacterium]|nr:MFS transporter [candidate division Zixibacteria bacterium]